MSSGLEFSAMSTPDSDTSSSEEWKNHTVDRRKTYRRAVSVVFVALSLYIFVPSTVLAAISYERAVLKNGCHGIASRDVVPETATGGASNVHAWQLAVMSAMVGDRNTKTLAAFLLCSIALLVIMFGTLPASILVTSHPKLAARDFEQKGTLSNITQDISTPHGRLWAVALFTASMLVMNSMYTMFLYRPWPQTESDDAFLMLMKSNYLASSVNSSARTLWAILPYLGLLITAVVPSLSGVEGYTLMLTVVHNVCAPVSLLYLMLMETIQLQFGEQAFTYFFSTSAVPVFDEPLNEFQRLRVITLVLAWTAGTVFVSVQGYLALYHNESFGLALVSYFGEVIGLILAMTLPPLAGIDILFFNSIKSPTQVASSFISMLNFPLANVGACS